MAIHSLNNKFPMAENFNENMSHLTDGETHLNVINWSFEDQKKCKFCLI